MTGRKAFVALVVTTAVLRILGAASAAANDRGDERSRERGSVRPCSLDGVNPAYHPYIFGNAAAAYAQYGFIRSRDGTWQVEPNCHR